MNSDKFYEMKYYKYKAKIAKLQNGGSARVSNNFDQQLAKINRDKDVQIEEIKREQNDALQGYR